MTRLHRCLIRIAPVKFCQVCGKAALGYNMAAVGFSWVNDLPICWKHIGLAKKEES